MGAGANAIGPSANQLLIEKGFSSIWFSIPGQYSNNYSFGAIQEIGFEYSSVLKTKMLVLNLTNESTKL